MYDAGKVIVGRSGNGLIDGQIKIPDRTPDNARHRDPIGRSRGGYKAHSQVARDERFERVKGIAQVDANVAANSIYRDGDRPSGRRRPNPPKRTTL